MSLIDVVGGVYDERCLYPSWRRLFGSGGRAAAAISRLGGQAKLHTSFDHAQLEALQLLAVEAKFDLGQVVEGPRIRFDYFHPLRASSTVPPRWRIAVSETGDVAGDLMLRFGMLESRMSSQAKRLVYDPQGDLTPLRELPMAADEIAIVCNLGEGQVITGAQEPEEVASTLLAHPPVVAVVVKMGPAGFIVATPRESTFVRCEPTETVFPIGSGDIYSAAFARAWLSLSRDPLAAAVYADHCVSLYCTVGDLATLHPGLAEADLKAVTSETPKRRRAYLAAPFFTMPQTWMIEQCLTALDDCGLDVFSPVHDVGTRGTPEQIARADLAGLETSDVVFAVVDGLDAGTLFEIGYARSRGIPVVTYGNCVGDDDLLMSRGTGAVHCRDFATAIYRAYWLAHG